VIRAGAAGSWWFEDLVPKMLGGDLKSGGAVATMQEELRLVMEAADDLAVSLPGDLVWCSELFQCE